MSPLTKKERMQIPRQPMPEQAPLERNKNFLEVNLGLTEELAQMEAQRCLQCPKPVCIDGCPVGVQIRDFIQLVSEGDFLGAAAKIKQDNALPAVCGRVPQVPKSILRQERLSACAYFESCKKMLTCKLFSIIIA